MWGWTSVETVWQDFRYALRTMRSGPASVGFTTVRIELFVDDPIAVHRQALAAGAIERSPVREHKHTTTGPHPIKRMLQGALVDPFGHFAQGSLVAHRKSHRNFGGH